MKKNLYRIPGWIASIAMMLVTAMWTYWGIAEMYHEGWWGSWTNRLPYLIPIAVTLIPTLISFRWPIVGGGLIAVVGVFAVFMFGGGVAIIGLLIAVIGVCFVSDGLLKRRFAGEATPEQPLWQRNWRTLLTLGSILLIMTIISAVMLPIVLTRQDDGDRGARSIPGNGVHLVWAPEGPGWNWQQPWGGYPSWQDIALYGLAPIGFEEKPGYGRQGDNEAGYVFATTEDMQAYNLCRYLSEDGLSLMDEAQDIWRMPTTDELVRSLVRHGQNAGCIWDGEVTIQAQCEIRPDKETPLWASDHPVIYYWSADAEDEKEGIFVSFNGWINATYKNSGNPRHSYRCVRVEE